MTYNQALEYIHSITWRGSRPGLSRTKELLSKIGNPQYSFKTVHIAGTNGKGSTSAFVESVLRAAGYKTGLYTSPYIKVFNERIQFCGEVIPDDELAEITEYVKPYADSMEDLPTEFELITAIGFEFFKRRGCEIAVIEAGMGGALDSTNVIPAPLVAVITAIGLDHTKELGGTVKEISATKSGIIKSGCRVVFYGENKEAEDEIRKKCEAEKCSLAVPDFSKIKINERGIAGTLFDCAGHSDIEIRLIGDYQVKNAATAMLVIDELVRCGLKISDENIRQGLLNAKWPGRFEVLADSPVIVFDGAHNVHGMSATVKNIKSLFKNKKIAVVMGVMADKNYKDMLELIKDITAKLYAVTPDNPRALAAHSLASEAEECGICAAAYDSVCSAVSAAAEEQGEYGTVFALGSLYMYGEISDAVKSLYNSL